ncbi:class I SAM-dependent methyltransferase [Geomonas subterranea]|uniref:Class I SAM-dependent methyltransferase n=1 Tax=Geomonas subterranea TaxID=2847989 RepID=A0ABX8LFA8_9BACT|nr:class I SAM-dependent methyltransferase [Geomonas subterranea]QXE90362.1 class I SAM-dependent methyltransferase [Geomonas subterranea]QXM07510.1 class I SAM-dependent methyltransferase [Geomonas subterranea]
MSTERGEAAVLEEEARAFNHQIHERMAHGHIPDLRRAPRCEWFINNPWRDPAYVKLDFYEQFELIEKTLRDQLGERAARVLEIGCGPGYLSLELSRAGHHVTGIDLSPACIEVARRMADEDPWRGERGGLAYLSGDLFAHPGLAVGSFDAVVFLGALHHFPDQASVMARVRELLRVGGIVIAHEPTRDRVTRGNAAFCHLLRTLLSAGNGFHADFPVPAPEAVEGEIGKLFANMRYETEDAEKLQSPNDNEAGFREMHKALSGTFKELVLKERYAFFHEFIGGLRFDEEKNRALARYLRDMDARLVELGVLQSTEFFFVGVKGEQ